MQKEPKVAVIILNWNGFDDTAECLASLKESVYINYKIVLVDNSSDNDEGDRLKDMFPDVHLIRNEVNRGFAGGNNDGMNWALENGFEYIINLNNDCKVEKNWLSHLVGGIRSADADFGSSRIMDYGDTNIIFSEGDVILPDGFGVSIGKNQRYSGESGIREIFSACGAGSIYSSRCLQDVKIKADQYFDELYFAYLEDVDLGIRLNSKAYKGVYVPEAVVYHKRSKTAGTYSRVQLFNSEKNRILNEILNYPLWLICLGEIFYVVKLGFKLMCFVLYPVLKKSHGAVFVKNLGIPDIIFLMAKARMWIICHFAEIMKDRKERKSKGFITSRVFRSFYWNLWKAENV